MLVGLIALLPLLAFAIFAALAALRSYRTADETRLRDTARALAAAVDAQLGTYLAALQVLATSRRLDGDIDAQAFAARSRNVGELFDGWVVLLGPPPRYRVLSLSTQTDQSGLPEELPPDNRHALATLLTDVYERSRPGISDLFSGAIIQRQILTAMVPVIRDGIPIRALALSIDPAALRALLARQDLPSGTSAAIADGQLRVLAHSFDPGGHRVGMQAPDWVSAAIRDKQSTLVIGPGWDGQDNVYAIERLRLAPTWTVTVAEPLATQKALAWAALRWLIAGGAALGLGLAVVVWAGRREAMEDARQEAAALRVGRAQVERLHGALPAVLFLRELKPDRTNRLTYRGGDIEMVTGWPAVPHAGVDSFLAHTDLEKEDHSAFFDQVARDGTGTIEYRMRQPDGSWRTLRTRCRLLGRREDGTCEVVGYILDVSAEREAQARAMSASRLASLGEMAAGLAHELKQPLQSISLAAEVGQIATAKGDTDEVDMQLEWIVQQTQRTADMIEHLRRFARGVEKGAPSQTVPLTAAVAGALTLMHNTLRDTSIEVEVDLGEPPLAVRGQEVLLEQVLSNLLLNARDALAARPDGAPRQIRIGAAQGSEGTVRLTVADTGGGIPPDVMARLFEPFVTTKGPDKGTGLGLSICHGLVKGMGGTIDAYNDAEGAVFTITLPGLAQGEALCGELPGAQ